MLWGDWFDAGQARSVALKSCYVRGLIVTPKAWGWRFIVVASRRMVQGEAPETMLQDASEQDLGSLAGLHQRNASP